MSPTSEQAAIGRRMKAAAVQAQLGAYEIARRLGVKAATAGCIICCSSSTELSGHCDHRSGAAQRSEDASLPMLSLFVTSGGNQPTG